MALNPNVSPHQFALPGMEEHAHPFAKALSEGLHLRYQKSPGHAHSLSARDDQNKMHANVQWDDKGSSKYPGHIGWAGNESPEKHQGLGTALFHAGHTFDFGQDTVPVHSPDRTRAGDRFAERVRPDLAPPNKDRDWRPPAGIHPYEQGQNDKHAAAVARNAGPKKVKGQRELFNPQQFKGRKA